MPMMIEEAESGLEPIAIVGMACRLPGSVDSASKFWDILREKKSVRTPRVPSSRFNIDAHYHPDLSRPGSFSAMGGYFLDEDPVDFDPSFFNITPVEAQWLDPQQRKVLEVCYEALENAGVSLEAAAGSNTGVYLATFTSDYQQISIFERDFRHNYAATGVDPGIISNRINNTFNLHGPSCVINTACSSSVYAIHNACHALRSRDCAAALAVGSNLVMIVDQHLNTAKLGVLSPTSECHTFDERADGYGRAEGIGALYLKRLSDAIRDRDVIRGVIRSSAVNTNGKVEGMGITYPNALGQEKVLRHAYKRANLNPNKTAYLECHGTGTPTGDPIEVRAVSLGMNDTRSTGKPLLLGAVKASIGHSEAASGIFATMKAALMTENAQIPGVYGFEKLNPNIKAKEWNVEIVRDLMPWPAEFDVRRASVSSFGYGGTNAHLVIECIESICPWYEHGKPIATAKYDYGKIDRPLLVTMSAHDEKTLRRNIQAHSQIAGDYYLVDMAYSLNERRTQLNSRGYVLVDDGHQAEAFNTAKFSYGTKLGRPARIGFIMTGQGAQWARMGYEAMRIFPQFAETLHALDRVLQQIEPVPTWGLTTILEQTAESSRVGEAEISQPVCTAIQIAIIDLFASWGIEPEVTVGHSSGEIAAAYASGRISAPEAILAAYFRGYAVARAAPVGTMLAVGVGAADMPEYLSSLDEDVTSRLAIACENSPGSVTMSGSEEDITLLKEKLDQSSIFARQLKTGKAYHSRQMDAVAPLYAELYAKARQSLDETQLSWRRPLVGMISSVTGTELDDSELSISYWCDNLRNRVLFDKAVTTLGDETSDFSEVNILIEIGPHAALGGPTKQIIQSNGYDMQYVPSLMRNANSAHSLLRTVGELYNRGLKIEFSLVNCISSPSLDSPASGKHSKKPRYLPDLPHYQWNYERKYWYQPRAMQELRESKFPRHDVLGRRIFGLSTNSSTWKNILRQRDVAWFADHILGTEVVFPAAGHVSLAIEALHQQLDLEPEAASGVRLRDISLHKALIVPETDEGVEVHTRLEKLAAGGWYSFTVESFEGGSWIQHSNGKIQKLPDESTQDEEPGSPYKASQLHRQVSGKRWYRSFNRVGFRYGTNFQTMDNVRANGKDRVASAGIQVRTECPAMENESRYLMHPSTIDGCLHVVIAAVHRGQHKEMPWGVIPVEIEEMTVKFPGEQDVNREGKCTAWVERALDRHFEGKVQLFSESGRCILDVKNWKFVTYDSAVPPSLAEPGPKKPYRNVTWVPATTEVDDEPEARVKDGRIAVFHVSKESSLASALNVSAVPLTVANSTLVDDSQLHSIVIDDADGSVLTTGLTEETWGAIQKMLQSGHPIVWVTRGANSGLSAASGTPQGFLRTVRSEALSSRINLVDADVDATTEQVAAFVQQRLAALSSAVESSGDLEHWLTKDRVLVPRIDTSDRLNDLMFGQKEATVDTLSANQSYKGIIVGDEVIFETPASESPVELAPLEAEIQVSFTTISKEILASRHLERARIVTGTVTRIGGDLDAGLIGQAVVAFTQKTLETHVVATVFVTLPDSSQDIASFLPHFVKAVDVTLLATSHGVAPGDHVLLLPTASPLFEQAVVELGVHLGFSVSKVPKDTVNAQSLLEASKGRITVIAAAPSPLITDFWLSMPQGARLVLSDVSVKDYALDMRPFARGVGLHVCDLSEAFKVDQAALQVTLQTSIDLVKRVTLPASHSLNVEELSDLDNARRVIAETGADILSFKYGEDKIKSRTTPEPVRFSGDSIYLLIGCLGGLGRSLTTWMLERGCRNFVFLSRSGTAKPEAADVVQHLQESGANVDVFCVDASDETAVANVVSTVSAQGSIKGVVHAAMVLKDGLYQTMTFSAYQTAMRPKVEAALVLDKVLGDMPLDFFIMTSSISAVLGNQGQANYAAANSFLDFLALQRRRQGRVACSLALPMVEDVGVVAENTSIADSLARKMPFGIDEREMLSGFEAAIIQGASSGKEVQLGDVQLILGLEPPAMLVVMEGLDLSDAFWYKDERMRPILEELEALAALMGKTGGGGGLESFTSKLVGLSADESLLAIGSHIMERSARILGAQAEDFQYESVSVSSHGIDSMIGVELQSWLFKEFGVQVSIQIISGTNTTFAGLARTISEHLGIV